MPIPIDGLADPAWAAELRRASGNDGVVSYWINKSGAGEKQGLKVSKSEISYIAKVFDKLDGLTGLTFVRNGKRTRDSDININSLSGGLGKGFTGDAEL
ncbi:hypothetical protein CPCC7001_1434 [Cyanobium sp. PCC 7001]|nr:hypothetical protein CPCC7001_1434 [Cyanobium sp. PCC 7001]